MRSRTRDARVSHDVTIMTPTLSPALTHMVIAAVLAIFLAGMIVLSRFWPPSLPHTLWLITFAVLMVPVGGFLVAWGTLRVSSVYVVQSTDTVGYCLTWPFRGSFLASGDGLRFECPNRRIKMRAFGPILLVRFESRLPEFLPRYYRSDEAQGGQRYFELVAVDGALAFENRSIGNSR